MRHQEVKVPEIRGGILADEMGMGVSCYNRIRVFHPCICRHHQTLTRYFSSTVHLIENDSDNCCSS